MNVTVKRLTLEREAQGLSRAELGRLSRIHPSRIGQFELGRAVPPLGSVELKRLARALGWDEEPVLLLVDVWTDS